MFFYDNFFKNNLLKWCVIMWNEIVNLALICRYI